MEAKRKAGFGRGIGIVCLAPFVLALTLFGCSAKPAPPAITETVRIMGDVTQVTEVSSMEGYTTHTITHNDKTLTCINLADVIAAAQPIPQNYTLLLVGVDGLVSEIDGGDLTGCHLAYTEDYQWELINDLHPISSRIKMLAEIVVVSAEEQSGVCFATAEGTQFITAGQLYKQGFVTMRMQEGQSDINDRWVKVYTTQRQALPETLIKSGTPIAVFSKDGSLLYDRPNAQSAVVLQDNRLDYITSTGETVKDIAGTILNPPSFSITEVFDDALRALEKNQKVLILELDGWGWLLQEYAQNQTAAPYLSSLTKQQALAVYPPVSTAGLAAMLTGENGSVNGITSRETKTLLCEDLFAKAAAMSKTSAYIEGSINMLNTSQKATLSPDTGGKDSGVFENTKTALAQGNDLVFAHFHSIDDVATTYGPYAPETMAQVSLVDKMVQTLAEGFNGTVIITADHGLHETTDGGSHGLVCSEDMLVPYSLIKGGASS